MQYIVRFVNWLVEQFGPRYVVAIYSDDEPWETRQFRGLVGGRLSHRQASGLARVLNQDILRSGLQAESVKLTRLVQASLDQFGHPDGQ